MNTQQNTAIFNANLKLSMAELPTYSELLYLVAAMHSAYVYNAKNLTVEVNAESARLLQKAGVL